MTTELKSMFSWIRTFVVPLPAEGRAEMDKSPLADFDPRGFHPVWHGDHWQNLLSSPMDARHYVMEDWTTASPPVFDNADTADKQEQAEGDMEPAY